MSLHRSKQKVDRRVVFIVFPEGEALDFVGPHDVFASAMEHQNHGTIYRLEVASSHGKRVRSRSGIDFGISKSLREIRGAVDTLIVTGGQGIFAALDDRALMRQIRSLAKRSRRVASICTGAFVLAQAGILSGKRATTHWSMCHRLASQFPDVSVDSDSIYVRSGKVYTSAGVTAGMDLALALVEEDCGKEVAMLVARDLVLFLKRPGGQSQFSVLLQHQQSEREPIRELQVWMQSHLREDLRVEALASRVHMSARNFARVFSAEIGETPARYVDKLRVEAARSELEESKRSIDEIAIRCGFPSAGTMRRSFLRLLGVVPTQYRNRFQF